MKTRGFVLSLAAFLAFAVLAGCASKPATPEKTAREVAIEQEKPIRTIPEKRPSWVDEVPDSPTTQSFVGHSERYATAGGPTGARYYAEETARGQLVDYYGTLMASKARTHAARHGISSDVFAPQSIGQQLNERIAQNISQGLAPRAYFTEVYLDSTNREAFVVYVHMQIDKALVRRVIDSYGRDQAADYARRAAAEQDAARKAQNERAAEFFGGNLSSTLGF